MKKRLTTAWTLVALPLAMWADGGQTVSVDGTTVNKTVKEITFSGTDVELSFTDSTTLTADMSTVNIAFGTATGVNAVDKDTQRPAASIRSQDSIWVRTKTSFLRESIS